jgi:hypothetical protein
MENSEEPEAEGAGPSNPQNQNSDETDETKLNRSGKTRKFQSRNYRQNRITDSDSDDDVSAEVPGGKRSKSESPPNEANAEAPMEVVEESPPDVELEREISPDLNEAEGDPPNNANSDHSDIELGAIGPPNIRYCRHKENENLCNL